MLFDARIIGIDIVAADDGQLSELMRWITVTHTQRWHASGFVNSSITGSERRAFSYGWQWSVTL